MNEQQGEDAGVFLNALDLLEEMLRNTRMSMIESMAGQDGSREVINQNFARAAAIASTLKNPVEIAIETPVGEERKLLLEIRVSVRHGEGEPEEGSADAGS